MSSPRIAHTPRPDAAPRGESKALAAIYRRAIERYQECKKATRPGGPDDARKDQDARTAHIIPE